MNFRFRAMMFALALPVSGPALAQQRLVPSSSWVKPSDYPADAAKKGEHGVVRAEITISPAGTVANCKSGYKTTLPSLAEATCKAISERAKYKPAHDKGGQPVVGKDTVSVEWAASPPSVRILGDFGGSIPTNFPGDWATDNDYNAIVAAVGSAEVGIRMRIGPTGRMTACGAYQSSGNQKLDSYTCALVASRARFAQPTDDKGEPMTTVGQIVVHWKKPPGR
jgi:TonB family protein